jgi:hypothetical protein
MAVFSLDDHSRCTLPSDAWGEDWTYSIISVEGVPGYAYMPLKPESRAACAIASSPSSNIFCIEFQLYDLIYLTAVKIIKVNLKSRIKCHYCLLYTLN